MTQHEERRDDREPAATRSRREQLIALGIAVIIGATIYGVLSIGRVAPPLDPSIPVTREASPAGSAPRDAPRTTTGQSPESGG